MPGESFRFIHASDFHLETPLGDLDAFPPHLKTVMAEAPRRAVQSVIDAALADQVDFLVLSGDLISPPTAGPHGMSLLLDGFEQLHAKGKSVYWAAGLVDDSGRWPEAVPLPPNVTLFPKNETRTVNVQRAGRTICHVIGRSCDGRNTLHVPSFQSEPTDEYTVGVGYGAAKPDALAEARFDYWALGGQHNRQETEGAAEAGAVYPGSPQGRDLNESGPHGYTMVDVDADRTTRIHNIDCDVLRYCQVDVDASEIAAVGGIRNLLGERIMRLQHEAGGRHLLLGWDISITSGETLQSVGDVDELMQWVRREYGHGTPSAWTVQMKVRPPREYPKTWCEEDTILGDFLRAAQRHRKEEGREINLLPFTEESPAVTPTTANLLAEIPSDSRMEVLDQATLLGVELLRGGKPNLVQKS